MSKAVPGGFLVVFDGIDGVGKTTQLQQAEAKFKAEGWQTLVRRNMGGTPVGEALREVLISNVARPSTTDLYISAAVQAALIEQVRHDRQAGYLILMDRGPLSLAAYEVYGSGLSAELARPHIEEGMAELRPDLTILYQAEVGTALKRARQASAKADYFESKSLDYFEKVARGYIELAEQYPNIVVIDANQSIDAVQAETMAAIRKALNTHRPH